MDECFKLWFHDCLHAGYSFLSSAGGPVGREQKNGLCTDFSVTEPVSLTEFLVSYLVGERLAWRGVIRRSGNIPLRNPT